MNTETPANAGESDAGRYGKATTTPKAMRSTRTILLVGSAHSAGKFGNTIRPCSNLVEEQPHESNRPVDDRADDDDEQQVRQVADDGGRGHLEWD